ncbi:MAG: HTH domain-containing protein [Atribacterota bacterium]|nr:HTH domain-containing protein [Atribacterota bacterium]
MYKKSIADLAYDILERNNRPMHYRKITEELEKIKEIKAEKPHHDVNASIGADQRFIRYQRGIWGLVRWKYKEAHLSYTLTSYCLLTGTVFLTSYLKPYFSWSRNDSNIEIIFVDTDGEEITASVNYRKKYITGLKGWYQKKKLDVNDRLLMGLIDDSKKKYFIIAEKEILPETERDISDTIYGILKEEEKPLSYARIYSAIIKQEPDSRGLFVDYIKNTLRKDLRYTEISEDCWGLTEWLNTTEKLFQNLLHANTIKDFHISLKKTFEFFGYKVDYIKNNRQDLLIVKAELDFKTYYLLITGLPAHYNADMIKNIDWPEMKRVRETYNINTVILFLKKIQDKNLIDRASEENVQLYEFTLLKKIMKEHQRIPFSLFELQVAFSPLQNPENNYGKLMEIRNRQWYYWNLIKDVVRILQISKNQNTYLDFKMLMKKITELNKYDSMDNYEILIKKIVNILNQEPFAFIELSESENMIISYQSSMINKRINSLFQFFLNEEENNYLINGDNHR